MFLDPDTGQHVPGFGLEMPPNITSEERLPLANLHSLHCFRNEVNEREDMALYFGFMSKVSS
jgi:ATP-dependent phosphoenolpyruvate carboxykinase